MRTAEREADAGGTVGRDPELAALEAGLEAGRDRPTVTLLVGEPGIGKSRLADDASAMARAAGTTVLRGESRPSWQRPMELWQGVARSLGISLVADDSLPADVRRWDHLEALAEALAASAPAVVVLEDLHWADAGAIWVLEQMPRALGDAPVAFVATSRDREPDLAHLDGLRRVARVLRLGGLDVEAVGLLAAAESAGPVDAAELVARTGGNPLFVQELVRFPGGTGLIDEVLDRSLHRFEPETAAALGAAAVAGPGTPLAVLAVVCSTTPHALALLLRPATDADVLVEVAPAGVRFRHALLIDAAARLVDQRPLHARLAEAWSASEGLDAQAAAAGHRLRAAIRPDDAADAAIEACEVAARLAAAQHLGRAAALLWDARDTATLAVDHTDLRARVALDLADALTALGDLDPAVRLYEEAAELARASADPVVRARAEIGADLWAAAFVPDLPRVRRLEDVLDALPSDELRLRAMLLGRLTTVGLADPDASDQVRAWSDQAVATAREAGDAALTAQMLVTRMIAATSRHELDAGVASGEEVVRLAERSGRADLALAGHQRSAGFHLNRGDVAAANHSLGRAEVLAAVLPSPAWRQSTWTSRTTLLALSGSRDAAIEAMDEAIRVGEGSTEPVVVLGCEVMHRTMLLDLYGHADPRVEELHQTVSDLLVHIPSPVFQIQKGFGAVLLGEEADVAEVLHRYGPRPEVLLRSMTGDHLLRVFGEVVARSGSATYADSTYRALLPYSGLLNVGGGHSAGLPVDDVLGRLAALRGDHAVAAGHAGDAVATARAMPSPPLLVHCLDHLADALERAGGAVDGAGAEPGELRAEADHVAAAHGIARPGRAAPSTTTAAAVDRRRAASMRRSGPTWILTSPLGEAHVADSTGVGQLARLLADPRVEVSALELAGQHPARAASEPGPALDGRAKREYRQRLQVLQAEIDGADDEGDPVRGERAQTEMDALLRELRRAVGLGGRDRSTGSDAERARVNVARSLRRAIAAVGSEAPLLGAHLEVAVRTGGHCIYLPDPGSELHWTVQHA